MPVRHPAMAGRKPNRKMANGITKKTKPMITIVIIEFYLHLIKFQCKNYEP